jgi:hypothetical protein
MLRLLPVLTVIAATSAAHAGVESGGATPVAKRSMALSFMGHASKVGGLDEDGMGPHVELALGSGRWQYFGEFDAAWVSASHGALKTDGFLARGGAGVRWLARSFAIEESGAIEMNLEAFTGIERFWWTGGGRLMRPDVGAGVGWQVRFFKPHMAFRIMTRVFFAPDEREAATTVCRGICMTTTTDASTTGIMALLGFQW